MGAAACTGAGAAGDRQPRELGAQARLEIGELAPRHRRGGSGGRLARAAGVTSRPEVPTARPAPNTTVAATACIHTGVDCRHHGSGETARVADSAFDGPAGEVSAAGIGPTSDADSEKPSSVGGGDHADSASRVSPRAASSRVQRSHACTCAAMAFSSSALPSL